MTESQGGKENVKAEPRVCPSCHRESDLSLIACWKCGTLFENKNGEKKTGSASSLLTPGSLVLIFALLVISLVLANNLAPWLLRGPRAIKLSVAKEQQPLSRKAPARQADPWKIRTASEMDKVYPTMGGPGAYHFLVTNLPQALVSKENQTLYFDGLIGAYLRSHDGAKLVEKNESMLGEQYRAVEYRIGFPYPEGGRMQPFIHHAVATMIDGKAYTVSSDYPQALSENGTAMKEHLLNSVRVAQKTSLEKSTPAS